MESKGGYGWFQSVASR